MEIEVLGKYAGARLLKVDGIHTPNIACTLPLFQEPDFSFSAPGKLVLPKPSPHASLEEAKKEDNTIHLTPDHVLPETLPHTDFVHLAGAQGLHRSQTRMPQLFLDIRDGLREDQVLFSPLLSFPNRYAILSMLGMDLFDSACIVEASREGMVLTGEGWHLDKKNLGFEALLEMNGRTAMEELEKVQRAIAYGGLRILAESRAVNDPWAASVLRLLDRDHGKYMEMNTPLLGPRLPTSHPHSMFWPEVARYARRLETRYKRPDMADILLLLPCSATKPYSGSRGHREVHEVVWNAGLAARVHQVIVTSPMGLVPRELETYYPNMQYDTSVTGQWTAEEKENTGRLLDILCKKPYKHVILHLPDSYLGVVGLDGMKTCEGRIDSGRSLENLHGALASLGLPRGSKQEAKERLRQDMEARLLYQFGEAGAEMAKGAEIRGRYPDQRIMVGGEQMGMLTKERGVVSLTLAGAEILASKGAYTVEIEDFMPRGDVFAVGVKDACKKIRMGDEAVVVHKGQVRAVGVAAMTPKCMVETRRGVAVKTRTVLKDGKA
ncbi:MAG: DUF5591 domain-containing protein [Candidatus Thermoplasmatota archaeon]|nr:DUF5591 domain-containing protein [Candidatus Thermoplasmatota archaeon]